MAEIEDKYIEKYFHDAEWKFSFDGFFNPCFYLFKNGKLRAMMWAGSDHLQFRNPANEFDRSTEPAFKKYFEKICGCSENKQIVEFLGRLMIEKYFNK